MGPSVSQDISPGRNPVPVAFVSRRKISGEGPKTQEALYMGVSRSDHGDDHRPTKLRGILRARQLGPLIVVGLDHVLGSFGIAFGTGAKPALLGRFRSPRANTKVVSQTQFFLEVFYALALDWRVRFARTGHAPIYRFGANPGPLAICDPDRAVPARP